MNLYDQLQKLEREGKYREMREFLNSGRPRWRLTDEAHRIYWQGVTAFRLAGTEGRPEEQDRARRLLGIAADDYTDNDDKAKCYSRAGVSYWQSGNLDAAKQNLTHALEIATEPYTLAIVRINLAIVFEEGEKHFADAHHNASEAEKLTSDLADDYLLGLASMKLGVISRHVGDYEDALLRLDDARVHFETVPNEHMLSLCHNNIADVLRPQGKLIEARNECGIAYGLARKLRDVGLLDKAAETYSEICEAQP